MLSKAKASSSSSPSPPPPPPPHRNKQTNKRVISSSRRQRCSLHCSFSCRIKDNNEFSHCLVSPCYLYRISAFVFSSSLLPHFPLNKKKVNTVNKCLCAYRTTREWGGGGGGGVRAFSEVSAMRKRRHKIEQEGTKQQQQQQRETREERSYKMAATTKRYYAYKRSYKKGRSRNAPTTKE